MRIRRYRGLLVIVLWQAAPAPVVIDSTGRVQLSLGGGFGEWEAVSSNCEGNGSSATRYNYGAAGGEADLWPTGNVRVSLLASRVTVGDSAVARFDYGGMAAYEGRYVGIGGGRVERSAGDRWFSGYLRLGNADRAHFRLDAFPMGAPFATTGLVRLGVGYGLGHQHTLGGQAGLSFCHLDCAEDEGAIALFGELRIPASRRFDLQLSGLAGPGQRFPNLGLAAGGRLHLAK